MSTLARQILKCCAPSTRDKLSGLACSCAYAIYDTEVGNPPTSIVGCQRCMGRRHFGTAQIHPRPPRRTFSVPLAGETPYYQEYLQGKQLKSITWPLDTLLHW